MKGDIGDWRAQLKKEIEILLSDRKKPEVVSITNNITRRSYTKNFLKRKRAFNSEQKLKPEKKQPADSEKADRVQSFMEETPQKLNASTDRKRELDIELVSQLPLQTPLILNLSEKEFANPPANVGRPSLDIQKQKSEQIKIDETKPLRKSIEIQASDQKQTFRKIDINKREEVHVSPKFNQHMPSSEYPPIYYYPVYNPIPVFRPMYPYPYQYYYPHTGEFNPMSSFDHQQYTNASRRSMTPSDFRYKDFGYSYSEPPAFAEEKQDYLRRDEPNMRFSHSYYEEREKIKETDQKFLDENKSFDEYSRDKRPKDTEQSREVSELDQIQSINDQNNFDGYSQTFCPSKEEDKLQNEHTHEAWEISMNNNKDDDKFLKIGERINNRHKSKETKTEKTKEELIEIRKMMVKQKPQSMGSKHSKDEPAMVNSELMNRLTSGERSKITKREMYRLTAKFNSIKNKDKETKKEELRQRLNSAKEYDKRRRSNILN